MKVVLPLGIAAGIFLFIFAEVMVLAMMLFSKQVLYILLLVLRTFEKEGVVVMKAIEAKAGVKSEWIRNVIGRFLSYECRWSQKESGRD